MTEDTNQKETDSDETSFIEVDQNSKALPTKELEIHRKYTDVPCCLLFVVWILLMMVISMIAVLNGDPLRLIAPKDSKNRPCGFDEMKSKPFLLYADYSKCVPRSLQDLYDRFEKGYICDTPMVCVEKCPENFGIVATFNNKAEYCSDGVWTNTASGNKIPPGCVGYVLPTVSVLDRCLPIFVFTKEESENTEKSPRIQPTSIPSGSTATTHQDVTKWSDGEGRDVDLEKVKEGLKALGNFLGLTQKKNELIRDVELVGCWFIFYFSLPFILSMIYIYLVRYFAFPMLMGVVVLLMIGSATSTYLTVEMYRDPTFSLNKTVGNNTVYEFIRKYVHADEKKIMLILCILLGLFTAVVFILSCCIFTGLRLACKCMAYASKIMLKNPALYFFPAVPWILQMLAFLWFVLTIVYVVSIDCQQRTIHMAVIGNLSCKTPQSASSITLSPDTKINVDNFMCYYCDVFVKIMFSIFLFGYFWLAYFILGFGQLTISLCFSKYYWTKGKTPNARVSVGASMICALKFHSGSMAFGAFLIGTVQFVRVLLEALVNKYERFRVDNRYFSRIVDFLRAALSVLHSMVQRLNENAYIMVGATGENFCSGVKKTLQLFLASSLRIITIWNSITFIVFLGECCIALATGYLSYLHMISNFNMIQNPVTFSFLISCFGFLYSSVVLDVYSVGVKTILFCLTEDTQYYGGSCVPEKLKKAVLCLKN